MDQRAGITLAVSENTIRGKHRVEHSEGQVGGRLLVGVTTYAGDFEQRTILRKTLRHLRARNGRELPVIVVSDGLLNDRRLYGYVDQALCRPGPCGLQRGELDSLRQLSRFARAHGYRYILKSAGDIILDQANWAHAALDLMLAKQRRMLSTHWFRNDSGIIGTKFFVAETDFLEEVLPDDVLPGECLENVLTASIARRYAVDEVAYLINSNTGEKQEVEAELRDWGWEHAHRLHKFVRLNDSEPALERWLNRLFVHPLLRLRRQIHRSLR